MKSLNELVKRLITLRQTRGIKLTLLAVCPNSAAVLEAAVKAAANNNMPMLFAATLNQVDNDGGYTGWTPKKFTEQIHSFANKYHWNGPLYPCLDHGGPWLKDIHTLNHLSLEETMNGVKETLISCIDAGYHLLHIDPTVDRTLTSGTPLPIETVVSRTVELISHAENYRQRHNLPDMAYEVGTEEVHGGLVDYNRFEQYLFLLRAEFEKRNLMYAWPCFVVAQVGTDLHTTFFDSAAAGNLYQTLSPMGSLAKGHYTDWVENPKAYPEEGMGGANVGPEFTAQEYLALEDLSLKEQILCQRRSDLKPSQFMSVLAKAVIDSGRWKKWLQPDEVGQDFQQLSEARQSWLLQTGSRYIWTAPAVVSARQRLYDNLSIVLPNPHDFVIDRIVQSIDRYVIAFNLFDSLSIL